MLCQNWRYLVRKKKKTWYVNSSFASLFSYIHWKRQNWYFDFSHHFWYHKGSPNMLSRVQQVERTMCVCLCLFVKDFQSYKTSYEIVLELWFMCIHANMIVHVKDNACILQNCQECAVLTTSKILEMVKWIGELCSDSYLSFLRNTS
jgi:hypothetical protein